MVKPVLTKSTIAIALSTLFSSGLMAQTKTTDDAEIERIAVWTTAVKTSAVYLKGETLANKQADHISDLLRTIPGVDVGGAHSLNQRITIRSMDDKDLNISIDGAVQNNYMYHHMGNLQIHADILKSVDIEIGSNSVVHGGLGGAVRFETKQARELLMEDQTIGGRVQVNGGDNQGTGYSLTGYGLLTEDIDFLAYYNAVERDNYDVGGGKIKDADGNQIAGTDGTVRGFEGELDDALIKFGWHITPAQRVTLSYERYQDQGDYSYRPDMGLATDMAITESLQVPLLWPTEFNRDTVTMNYELQWGDASELKAALYSNTSELFRDESGYAKNPDYAGWAGLVTGEAKNTGFNVIGQSAIDSNVTHELVYGLDYVKHDTHYQGEYAAGTQTSNEESKTKAVFVQDRIEFSEHFAITPGLRYEHYDINSKVVDNSFSDLMYSLAAEFQVNNDLLFKLSSTSVFKGPEIGEVFVGAGSRDTENQDIDAETGTNTEISFAYQTQFSNELMLTVGATGFDTKLNDYIYDYARIPGGGRRDTWKDNVGDMKVDGYEAYVGFEVSGFDAQLTYSSAESELRAFSDYASLDGARLDRQQGDTLTASVDYQLSELDLNLHWDMMHVGDVDAGLDLGGASLDNAKSSFTVHNISVRWEPQALENMTVIVGVDNLFDEYYASHSSHTGVSFHPRFGDLFLLDYEPGRNIKATVSYQF